MAKTNAANKTNNDKKIEMEHNAAGTVEFLFRLYDGTIKAKDVDWEMGSQDIKRFSKDRSLRFNLYVAAALDINFVIDRHGNYKNCVLMTGLGGPNSWIETDTKKVCVSWGDNYVETALSRDICDAIDKAAEAHCNLLRSNVW